MKLNNVPNTDIESNPERKEQLEFLFLNLLRSSEYVDHGKDGVILKINPDSISDEDKERWQTVFEVDFSEGAAIKALKVFNPEMANRELFFQKKAYDVLKGGDRGLAGVPKILVNEVIDAELTDEVASMIPHTVSRRTNFMVMEWVHGTDMATGLFRSLWKILSEEQGLEYSDEELESKDISNLAREVFSMMKLQVPEMSLETGVGEMLLMNQLVKKLSIKLRRSGKELNPFFINQVINAIRSLSANGIYHNDLHARNIICDGEVVIDSNLGQEELRKLEGRTRAYVIDFGRSKMLGEDGYDAGVARQEGEALFNDWRQEGDIAERVLVKSEVENARDRWYYNRSRVIRWLKSNEGEIYPNFSKLKKDDDGQFQERWLQLKSLFWNKMNAEMSSTLSKFSDIRNLAREVLMSDEFFNSLDDEMKREVILRLVEVGLLKKRRVEKAMDPRYFKVHFMNNLGDDFFDDDDSLGDLSRDEFLDRVYKMRQFMSLNERIKFYSNDISL